MPLPPVGLPTLNDTSARRTRAAGRIIVIVAALAIALATLLPSEESQSSGAPVCVFCGAFDARDVVSNVLLFVPFGLGIGLLVDRSRTAVVVVLATTMLVELAQFQFIGGRDASLGDVLANAAGGMLGYGLARHWRSVLWPTPARAFALCVAWVLLWLFAQVIAAYSFYPASLADPYYAQVGPRLGGMSSLRGRVDSVTIDTLRLQNERLGTDRTARLRRWLFDPSGGVVRVRMNLDTCPESRAPIVRIVGARRREVLMLAQAGEDLVYTHRTGADMMRLRRYEFRLSEAFARACRSESGTAARIEARYSPAAVTLASIEGHGARRDTIVPRLSDAWRLLAPTPTSIRPGWLRDIVGAAWIVALIGPGVYWMGFVAVAQRDSWRRALLAVGCLVLVSVGFLVVPQLFSMQVATPMEWTAAIGAVFGFGAAGTRVASRPARTTL
jgi:hypothetical protein